MVLEKLIDALSSPRVDIYLHLDAKVKDIPEFLFHKDITLIKRRINTRWGDISQIETEYALFKEAYKKGEYSHYHLISGTHFPLTSIDRILDYYESRIGYSVFNMLLKSSITQESLKLRRYNFLTRYLADDRVYVKRLAQRIWQASLTLQERLGLERNKSITFYKANNWVSLSEEAIEILLNKQKEVMKVFRYSFCGDEYFVPTVLMGTPLKDRLIKDKYYLKVEMKKANPRFFSLDDYEMLISCGSKFARKFSDANIDLVDKIIDTVL